MKTPLEREVLPDRWLIWTIAIMVCVFFALWSAIQYTVLEIEKGVIEDSTKIKGLAGKSDEINDSGN